MLEPARPLAPVPLGTANNLARTLGIPAQPKRVMAGLATPRRRTLDVGRVHHPWGDDDFLEAVGFGVFAELLYDYDPDDGKSVRRALGTLRNVLADYEPKELLVTLDGEDLSERYLGLEILNTKATGPRLKLAPDADPCDGLLDVVRVMPYGSEPLLGYAAGLATRRFDALPNVEVRRGRRLELVWNGGPLHVDSVIKPLRKAEDVEGRTASWVGRTIEVEVREGARERWLPGGRAGDEDARAEEESTTEA